VVEMGCNEKGRAKVIRVKDVLSPAAIRMVEAFANKEDRLTLMDRVADYIIEIEEDLKETR